MSLLLDLEVRTYSPKKADLKSMWGSFPHDKKINRALFKRGWISGSLSEVSPYEHQKAVEFCEERPSRIFLSPHVDVPDRRGDLGSFQSSYYEMWFSDQEMVDAFSAFMKAFVRNIQITIDHSALPRLQAYIAARAIENYFIIEAEKKVVASLLGNDDDALWIKLSLT